MKNIYFRVRIFLITFTLGLASAFVTFGSLSSGEVKVLLPEVYSDVSICIFPVEEKNMGELGDSSGITKCNRRELTKKEMKKINSNNSSKKFRK